MIRKLVTLIALGSMTLLPSAPAGAVDILDVRGIIHVDSDFSACGTATFQTKQLQMVGTFTAVGFGRDGSVTATIHEAVPVVGGHGKQVTECIPGFGSVPDVAEVTYYFEVHGTDADTVTGKTCIKSSAGFSCYHV
jgi:hypothetical protein